MKYIGIFSVLILLLLSSCRKDVNEVTIEIITPIPEIENYDPVVKLIQGDVIGFIVDEQGEPIADAYVTMNDETAITDEYGHFFMTDKTMNSLGTLIKVQKENYFMGSRRFFPKEGEKNRVKIQLISQNFDDAFNAVSGGTISTSDGASVLFKPNSIVKENGEDYTGIVEVAIKWLNPASLETLDQMPGNLQGVNSTVEEKVLETYGIIAVELQGENGETLHIANDKTATISMPIPSNLLNSAPTVISLWSYNEEYGLWVEESSATLENEAYVGEVTHFSFWNLNDDFDFVNFDLTLVDSEGEALNNYPVLLKRMTDVQGPSFAYNYTDENGNVTGIIPANEELTLKIYGLCDIIYNEEIGPFSEDVVETIVIENSISTGELNDTKINGVLVDCNNEPVTNGLVKIDFNASKAFVYTDEQGGFDISLTSCIAIDELMITGINIADSEKGEPVTVLPNVETTLNELSACGTSFSNYLEVTIDGVSKTYDDAYSYPIAGATYIQIGDIGEDPFHLFSFEGITTGDYSGSMLNLYETPIDSTMGWDFNLINPFFSAFNVTQFDTRLVGNASGDFEFEGETIPIEIIFDLIL